MNIYKDKSNPLVEVPIFELEDKKTYVVDNGSRVMFNEENNEFIVIQNSVLNMGELMIDLTPGEKPNSLGLYWTIMNNKIK